MAWWRKRRGWIYNESRGVGLGFVRVLQPSQPSRASQRASDPRCTVKQPASQRAREPASWRARGCAGQGCSRTQQGIQSPRDLYNSRAKPSLLPSSAVSLPPLCDPTGGIANNKRLPITGRPFPPQRNPNKDSNSVLFQRSSRWAMRRP